MAKDKLKKAKKKSSNNGHYTSVGGGEDSDGKANRRSLRPRRKGSHKKDSSADDARLRQAVEGDGSRTIIDTEPDGNCLFRSISDQLYYDYGNSHAEVRDDVCNYLAGHKDSFSVFLVLDDDDEDAPDFESYVTNMREDGDWGGHVELVAASRMYRRNITVFTTDLAKYTIEHGSDKKSAGPDLVLSYHDNDHYNSVRSTTASKPPPPTKTFVLDESEKCSASVPDVGDNEMELDERTPPSEACTTSVVSEETNPESADSLPVAMEQQHQQQQQRPFTKQPSNEPCSCGSGERFKKCCGSAAAKKAARARQRKATIESSNAAADGASGSDSAEQVMDGTFRVLHI